MKREHMNHDDRRTTWKESHSKVGTLLSESLVAWHKRTGRPLKEMAAHLGVAVSTISGWMTGHRFPDKDHLDALSAYTGLPARCLFCDRTVCLAESLFGSRPNRSVNRHAKGHLSKHAIQEIIEESTRFGKFSLTMEFVLQRLQEYTGFECIGVRIKDETGDYPYVASTGFRKSFIEKETSLLQLDHRGHVRHDHDGRPKLECMCGNVLRGWFDSHLPFFTDKGSFWTNSTTALLASTTAKDRQSRTRNTCNAQGYESVALFPLILDGETVGLLQLNDHRKNMFSHDAVREYEHAATNMAAFLYHATIFRNLDLAKLSWAQPRPSPGN